MVVTGNDEIKHSETDIAANVETLDSKTPNVGTVNENSPLGFESLLGLMAFGLLCALLALSPFLLSGFWPVSYDLQPQLTFLGLTTCAVLLLALRPLVVAGHADNSDHSDNFDQNSRALPAVRHSPFIGWLLLAFLGWSGIATATAVYRHDALLEMARVGGAVAWFFVARSLLYDPRPHIARRRGFGVLGAVVLGALLVCALAVINFVVTRDTRQFGTFYNPNLFANYCAMALPLGVAWLLEIRRRGGTAKVLFGATLVIAVIAAGLVLTSSKGGLLALLGALVVFALSVWRARGGQLRAVVRQHRRVLTVAALIFVLAGGALAWKTVLPRVRIASTTDQNSTMFRAYTWRGTLRLAQARPLTGWGPGNFSVTYPQFAITGPTLSAHQVWLQLAAEHGVPAVLLLLGAIVLAARRGWRALRAPHGNWPLAAGALASLAGFIIHGCTDAGWGITSITLLLMIVLAMLCAADAEMPAPSSRFPLFWLAAALLLAVATWGLQKAATAADARNEAERLSRLRAPLQALEQARVAVATDALDARSWSTLGQIQEFLRQNPEASYRQAIALQPTRAANWLNLAIWLEKNGDADAAEAAFDTAVTLDPNGTFVRLARARWLLAQDDAQSDARGWADLEYIARLAAEPYGRYPALADVVNLDFTRAYLPLAERALQKGNLEQAEFYARNAAGDIARAREYEDEQRQLRAALGPDYVGPTTQDVDELAAQLSTVQEKLAARRDDS